MQTAIDEPETWKDLVSCLICCGPELSNWNRQNMVSTRNFNSPRCDKSMSIYTYDASLNFHNSTPSQSEISQCTPLFSRDLANFLCGMRSTVNL